MRVDDWMDGCEDRPGADPGMVDHQNNTAQGTALPGHTGDPGTFLSPPPL